jgi:hypothetical protein
VKIYFNGNPSAKQLSRNRESRIIFFSLLIALEVSKAADV